MKGENLIYWGDFLNIIRRHYVSAVCLWRVSVTCVLSLNSWFRLVQWLFIDYVSHYWWCLISIVCVLREWLNWFKLPVIAQPTNPSINASNELFLKHLHSHTTVNFYRKTNIGYCMCDLALQKACKERFLYNHKKRLLVNHNLTKFCFN